MLFVLHLLFFCLAAYPRHHVIILVQMTQLMLNIYITQISVVGDRQLKYSAFIPILLWSANTSLMYIYVLNMYYVVGLLLYRSGTKVLAEPIVI